MRGILKVCQKSPNLLAQRVCFSFFTYFSRQTGWRPALKQSFGQNIRFRNNQPIRTAILTESLVHFIQWKIQIQTMCCSFELPIRSFSFSLPLPTQPQRPRPWHPPLQHRNRGRPREIRGTIQSRKLSIWFLLLPVSLLFPYSSDCRKECVFKNLIHL